MKKPSPAVQHMLEQEGAELETISRLIAHLSQAGKLTLLRGIHRELLKISHQKQAVRTYLEIAREADREHALKAVQNAGITSDVVVINPTLISGWRIRTGDALIDRSGKRALLELYTRVTATVT